MKNESGDPKEQLELNLDRSVESSHAVQLSPSNLINFLTPIGTFWIDNLTEVDINS